MHHDVAYSGGNTSPFGHFGLCRRVRVGFRLGARIALLTSFLNDCSLRQLVARDTLSRRPSITYRPGPPLPSSAGSPPSPGLGLDARFSSRSRESLEASDRVGQCMEGEEPGA